MKRSRLPLLLLAIGYSGLLITGGCDSATKRKWLTTFFDGVPPEHPVTNAVAAAPADTNLLVISGPKPPIARQAEEKYYGHPPFSQEKCTSCHASQFGQGMKKPAPGLC